VPCIPENHGLFVALLQRYAFIFIYINKISLHYLNSKMIFNLLNSDE